MKGPKQKKVMLASDRAKGLMPNRKKTASSSTSAPDSDDETFDVLNRDTFSPPLSPDNYDERA